RVRMQLQALSGSSTVNLSFPDGNLVAEGQSSQVQIGASTAMDNKYTARYNVQLEATSAGGWQSTQVVATVSVETSINGTSWTERQSKQYQVSAEAGATQVLLLSNEELIAQVALQAGQYVRL